MESVAHGVVVSAAADLYGMTARKARDKSNSKSNS
jgi:hypothetical protein